MKLNAWLVHLLKEFFIQLLEHVVIKYEHFTSFIPFWSYLKKTEIKFKLE